MSEMGPTGLKSKCQLGWFLLEAAGEGPFLVSSNF